VVISLFLFLVEQGGFEVPSKEAEDQEESDYFNTCCRLWLRLWWAVPWREESGGGVSSTRFF
jgi:hypothetical protein